MRTSFDNTKEGRNRFLRHVHKSALPDRAVHVLGSKGAKLLRELKSAYLASHHEEADQFESSARCILRHCAAIKGDKATARRLAYIRACIKRQNRIAELMNCWAKHGDDPGDNLDVVEDRECADELAAFYREQSRVEKELSELYGEVPGLIQLRERLGFEKANDLAGRVLASEEGWRRYNSILSGAAKPSVKYPDRYIAKALANERRSNGR